MPGTYCDKVVTSPDLPAICPATGHGRTSRRTIDQAVLVDPELFEIIGQITPSDAARGLL